jgi:hypothetical protein
MFGLKQPILAHTMLWFGDGHTHKDSGYKSGNRNTIWAQLSLMKSVGIAGVIVTWMGLANPYIHAAAQEMCWQCERLGLLFCLLMDPHIGGYPAASLNSFETIAMLNSPAYVPQKYVLDFATGNDLALLGKQFPNLKFLAKHTGFSWPEKASGGLSAAENSLATMKRDAGCPIPGLCLQFNGGWPPAAATIIDPLGGQFFKAQVNMIPNTAEYGGLITWNDYDEGTALESFFAMQNGVAIL